VTTLHIYLAQDRLRALARGESLPSRTTGSALFADISGFTALTEALRNSLGARRGAEELTRRIEAVYSALITQIELFGGSVIEFAGDSMLCWFDDDLSVAAAIESLDEIIQTRGAQRAVACGVVLQRAMRAFTRIVLPDKSTTALTLKVAVASGTAHRFIVGTPSIRQIDTLVGATIARTATAEHQAHAGEVILDEVTTNIMGEGITIQEWREDKESNERFAVIGGLTQPIDPPVLMQLEAGYLMPEELHPWVHAPLVEREQAGQVAFLIEFRPCVTMFVRFTGIDFDHDLAGPQLDAFICQAQEIVARHGGTFLQLTIGDKGSYAYINFGVLSAHEDDARRAVGAALELQDSTRPFGFLQPLQIGITQGTLRVGAYGGHSRKTFGALGDEVNLAARLMTTAAAGEILLSGHVHKAVEPYFVFEPRYPVGVKGKAEPVPVFAVTGDRKQRAIRLQEPTYALPMVGRANELMIIEEKLELALSGKSQVIGLIAEAGMGKSRLVAEVIRLARRKGFGGYGGACLSDGVNTPYFSWKPIWSAFFDIDPAAPLKKQMRTLENALEDYAPDRLQAMPLLKSVLDMDIPENDFTSSLEPQYRKSALTALFEDCLRAAAKEEPILIVVEDVHWIDTLSHDLLEDLAKTLVNCPVCLVLAYRPAQLMRLQASRLEVLPQFTKIELHELNRLEAEQAIRAKLAQLYPARAGAIPVQLVDRLMERAQGNPFYLEELLNYLRDRGLDPRDPADLQKIELPDSLHALVLSRIDQLSEREKTTLRVASIVGRLFRAAWLPGYYPALGDLAHVKVDLDKLESMDITPLDSEADLAYLFKHIVTHEVTYESLPFGLRAQLHEQLARYLEKQIANGSLLETAVLDILAFHYSRSNNAGKQREYLRKAGEAAQKSFANDGTLEYYGRLLPLLTDAMEKTEIHLKRGQVLELMGKWDDAESDYRAALELSKDNGALKASTQFALGKLSRLLGKFEFALEWLVQAKEMRTALGDNAGLAQVLVETGFVLGLKGEIAQGRESLKEGLILARETDNKLDAALALTWLGGLAGGQGDYATGRALLEQSLNLHREIGEKRGIASSLTTLGYVAYHQGDYATARPLFEESLNLHREIGDKRGIAGSLYDLGTVAYRRGDYTTAQALLEQALSMAREMGDRNGTAMALNELGNLATSQGDYAAGQALYQESLSLQRAIGNKWGIMTALTNLGNTAYVRGEYVMAQALFEEDLALCTEMDEKRAKAYALLGLGLVDLALNKPEAREYILHSLRVRQETGEQLYQTSSLVGMAGLALHKGDATFAAQLLGAVESAIKALNGVLEGELIPFHAQTLAAVREQLGESAFQSAWKEGAGWSLENAVQRALDQ
jgi:adenylate cyclase